MSTPRSAPNQRSSSTKSAKQKSSRSPSTLNRLIANVEKDMTKRIVQIKGNDGKTISAMDLKNPNQSQVINLMERLDITTEDGKHVYRFGTGGGELFNSSTFKANYEVIDNSYVVYSIVDENSNMIQRLKQFTKPGKINKFIVTVTPRLSSDLLKTGSKLFTTKSLLREMPQVSIFRKRYPPIPTKITITIFLLQMLVMQP